MSLPRYCDEYQIALNAFLDEYFAKNVVGDQISCCKKCKRRFYLRIEDVFDHLVAEVFVKGFAQWMFEMERLSSAENMSQKSDEPYDDIDGLLHDTFRDIAEENGGCQGVGDEPNEDARKFYKLVEEGKQELYPGCKSFSKLSFIIRCIFLSASMA